MEALAAPVVAVLVVQQAPVVLALRAVLEALAEVLEASEETAAMRVVQVVRVGARRAMAEVVVAQSLAHRSCPRTRCLEGFSSLRSSLVVERSNALDLD